MHTAGHPSAPHPHQETSLLSRGALSPMHRVLAACPGAADRREVSEPQGHTGIPRSFQPQPLPLPPCLGSVAFGESVLGQGTAPLGFSLPISLPTGLPCTPRPPSMCRPDASTLCAGFCCGRPSLPPRPPPQLPSSAVRIPQSNASGRDVCRLQCTWKCTQKSEEVDSYVIE